ncbi:hypothetical protein HPB47_012098 [Ixodes persulcatus]|uniref:Uncharacterized protein n=1 Tax=Ixodes persulcatus TaxID=34615 RepID=A0AC60NUF7_IXOPE|nr:hypothetical protein HPB47_012098 [Ixodes persulcatus]
MGRVKELAQIPDLHLVKMWDKRLEALLCYRTRKSLRNKIRLNHATAEAKRYTIKLCRTIWHSLCDSFNERTGYRTLWKVYKGLAGKTKTSNTGSNLALRLDITEEELAEEAGDCFFPQQSKPPTAEVYTRQPILHEHPADAPFTLAELLDAHTAARAKTAPGPDLVTITSLRNLPLDTMKELLKIYNAIWMEGELPADWKRSTVIPITKPGKTPHTVANLRPISLTSNLCKVMERMVTARLSWILESTGAFHPMQTGFRPHLSTQDSLLMIHHDLYERRLFKSQPRTLVAIDLRKAFDSIPHSTIVSAAKKRGVQGRLLNFIKTFLQDRTFQVSIGQTKGQWRTNNIGVPQGAVLSPLLFNLAMVDLALALEAVPEVRFTIYADDVTLWTTAGGAKSQQNNMQRALNIVTTFALKSGLELSKEKTTYMVIPCRRRSTRTDIELRLDGIAITPTNSVKILGVTFEAKGGAVTWLRQVKSQWKDGIELLKAISSKAWGAQEDLLRRLVRTILTSKVVYGLNYLRLTKNQEMALVTMMRAVMRVVTGLPRFTPVDQLERIAQMNTIREISDEMRISQARRLSRTPHGRIILTSSGRPHLIEGPLIPTPTPPWDAEVVTPVKPLPSHQGLENPGRRATQAAIHRSEISKLAAYVEVFYTDAARDDSGRTAIAWHSPTRNETSHQLASHTKSTCTAELFAIMFAVETATTTLRPEIRETRIYTDSQEAVRALRRSSTCNATVAQIRELVRQAGARQTIIIAWIPGHADIPGNERADGAARALLQASIQPSQGPVPSPVQRDVPPDEDYDPSESKKEEKRARKERLSALLPSNPHPIPRGLPRWEQVALHRLQSRSMVTPVWRARFHRPTDQQDTGPDPNCIHCGVLATCHHLVWSCPGTSPERVAAINSLPPPLRPTTLREWTHPRTSAPADETLVFSSIISYLRSSGTGRYI